MEAKIDDVMDKIQVKWESDFDPTLSVIISVAGFFKVPAPIGFLIGVGGLYAAVDAQGRQTEINSFRKILESDKGDVSCRISGSGDDIAYKFFSAEKVPFYINRIDSDFQIGKVEGITTIDIVVGMGLIKWDMVLIKKR